MPESVYISSTFNDLKQFRQAVINCVISLVDYYKPVSMEFYDADDIHFVKKCLDDVEACNIYILIMGKRYGYIPKGFTKSITEMEYEKALECKKNGKQIEILVFRIGDLCNTYTYKENDPEYVAYQEEFLTEVSERLSPKPFDSEAELALQVSYSLMKRLYKHIKTGEKIVAPDKDAVLCYCDRVPQMNQLKTSVLIQKKRVFFLHGNRKTDFPTGIVKRFAKYSMGSQNKIDPLLKITDLVSSNDQTCNYIATFWSILEYINMSPDETNTTLGGFINALSNLKSGNVILPFYYDFDFDEDANKLNQFIQFIDQVYSEYQQSSRSYRLFFVIVIYSVQPDAATINNYLEASPNVKTLSVISDKLKNVEENDIIDWLEKYITSSEFSPSLYNHYFDNGAKTQYTMQEVNLKLGLIVDDLEKGSEHIMPYL